MFTLNPIQQPVEYINNPDVRVYMRPKNQNSGLFLWQGDLNAVSKDYHDATIGHDGAVYAVNRTGGTIEKFNLATGAYDSTPLSGLTAPRAIQWNGRVYIIIASDTVYVYDTGFNLIHNFGTTGSGNSNFINPNDFIVDHNDRLTIVDTGNDRLKQHGIGQSRANITATTFNGCCADNAGNTYYADTTANTIRKYNASQVEITTGGFPITFTGTKAPVDVSFYLNGTVPELYVAVNDSVAINAKTIGVYNASTGATIDASRVSAGVLFNMTWQGVSITANYIVTTRSFGAGLRQVRRYNRSDGSSGYTLWENSDVTSTLGGIHAIGNYAYFTMNQTMDKYAYRIEVNGGYGQDTIEHQGVGNYTDVVPVPNNNDIVYLADTVSNTIIKYARQSQNNWVALETISAGTVGNIRLAFDSYRDDLIMSSDTNNVQFYNWGLWIANHGSTGTGNGQFNSPYGIAQSSTNGVFVTEYGTNNRVQQFDDAYSYIKQLSVSGGASDVAISKSDLVFIGVHGSKQILVYEADVDNYYTQFYAKGNAEHLSIPSIKSQTLFVGDTDPFYAYSAQGDFSLDLGDRVDITKHIDFTQAIKIGITSDEKNFSIGRLTIGNVSMKLFNDGFYFDSESFLTSIFHTDDYSIARNETLVEIEVDGKPIFHGFVDGKNIKPSRDQVSITVFELFKRLKTIEYADLEIPAGARSMSAHIALLLDNIYVRDYIAYDASEIQLENDFTIDNPAELGDNILEQLETLAELGFFTFGVYDGNKFFTYSFRQRLQERRNDCLLTKGALLDLSEFNRGEQRLFSEVIYKASGAVGSDYTYNFDDRVKFIYPEKRAIEIDSEAITNTTTRQAIVDQYASITQFPTKEFKLKSPLFVMEGDSVFRKQFGINLGFAPYQPSTDDPRELGVNVKTLELGNGILASKETAVEKIVNSNRNVYWVLGIEYELGERVQTVIKLKEAIDDDQVIYDFDANVFAIFDFEKADLDGAYGRNAVYDITPAQAQGIQALANVGKPIITTEKSAHNSRSLQCVQQADNAVPWGLVNFVYGDHGYIATLTAWKIEFNLWIYHPSTPDPLYEYGIFGKDTDRGAPDSRQFALKIKREQILGIWYQNIYLQFGSAWLNTGLSFAQLTNKWSHWYISFRVSGLGLGVTLRAENMDGSNQQNWYNPSLTTNPFAGDDSNSDMYFGSDKDPATEHYLIGNIDSIIMRDNTASTQPFKLNYIEPKG